MYRKLTYHQTQIVQSKEIATAGICHYLFKLSYPYGVVKGHDDYFVADTTHDIMSLVTPSILLDNWTYGITEYEQLVQKIESESKELVKEAVLSKREEAKKKQGKVLPETFDEEVNDRFRGILRGFAKRIMKGYRKPNNAVTEITITNVKTFHEGRIDAILEFPDGTFGTIDWKTYNINRVNGGHEKYQLIANLMLSNYRYTGNENDWSKLLFGAVVYYENSYIPRLPLSYEIIKKIKNDRKFAYDVLCGNRPRPQRPKFCPVCDNNMESCSDCQFYRKDFTLTYNNKIPNNYREIRGGLLSGRYNAVKARAETHRHKFVLTKIIDQLGEEPSLNLLEEAGIIATKYRLDSFIENSNGDGSTLVKLKAEDDNFISFFEPRKIIRIISREENRAIPILACVSEKCSVREVIDGGSKLVIEVYGGIVNLKRAKGQIFNGSSKLILIPDEINLTSRVLEPMHRFHRIAADMLVDPELFEIGY
ncbi:MAG: hypothetical protein ABJB85_09040 [Nitrososphaerota archaeon]